MLAEATLPPPGAGATCGQGDAYAWQECYLLIGTAATKRDQLTHMHTYVVDRSRYSSENVR